MRFAMAVLDAKLLQVAVKDGRYAYEAYDFIFKALDHAQTMLGRRPSVSADQTGAAPPPHVKSHELLDGLRSLALQEFGLMAQTVFRMWGVESTEDFGRIVFN